MKKLVFPLIFAVVGTGGGVGAGLLLRPEPEPLADINPCDKTHGASEARLDDKTDYASQSASGRADGHDTAQAADLQEHEYIKLNNQFVVPVVSQDMVDSLVVMSLSIETMAGQSETIYAREPKLRDAFLQVLFDHANIGGFDGAFTDANNLDVLRMALTETAQTITGDIVNSVLITDIARQDL